MFTLTQPLDFFSMSTWWFINAFILMCLLIFVVLTFKRSTFFNFKENNIQHTLWLSITFALSIIWLIRAQLLDHLYLHFIGVSLTYLLLGAPLTGLALTAVLLFTNITRHIPAEIWGAQYALSVLFPLLLSFVLHGVSAKFLPKRVFAFIFVHGFFVTAAIMAATVGFNLLILNDYDVISLDVGNGIFWVSSILLGWGEAFMTGMVIALVAVYRPHWLQHRVQFRDV